MATRKSELREIEGDPRTVADMTADLKDCVTDASQFILQAMDNFSVRNCLWGGQSEDGRKHAEALGEDAFPWEGSSDTRIRLADEIINDHVVILVNALMRSGLKATSIEAKDMREAGAMTTFLQWLFGTKIPENVRCESRLIANWQELYGHAIMAVTWDQEVTYESRIVMLEELQMMARTLGQQNPQAGAQMDDMIAAIFDENRDEEVIAWLMTLNPEMRRTDAKRALKGLREDGQFETYYPRVVKSQPLWTAMRPYRDVFYPANTTNIQTSRWLAYRETLTAAELRARVKTDDYEETEVEEVIETCLGDTIMEEVVFESHTDSRRKILSDEMEDLIEIFCFYERVSDDRGGMKVRKTIFAPGREDALWEGDSAYAHNAYPCVKFCPFQTERLLIENEGVPEKVGTSQTEIKVQRDYRVDRSSIAIMPPIEVPQFRQNLKLEFGPAKRIPVRKRGEIGAMDIGSMDPDTATIEAQIMAGVDSYFARWKEGVHPARQQLYSQTRVDDFLASMAEVAKMTLALCRQYWTDDLFQRVTGVKLPFQISEDRPIEAYGYDIQLSFNASDLDLETVYKKLDVISKAILPADVNGEIKRGPILKWAMRAIDYGLAEEAITNEEDASFQEVEDEQLQITKMMAGVEPIMKKAGQNVRLRMQTLQNNVQKSPRIQQAIAQDETVKALFETRAKHFQFLLQQQQNAQIGRVGAAPAMGGAAGGGGNGQGY